MTKRTLLLIGVVAVVCLAGLWVFGVVAGVKPDRPEFVRPTATTPASPSPASASLAPAGPPASVAPLRPTGAALAAYLADLNAIDARIVGRHTSETMVSRGRSQCSSIADPRHNYAKLVELANYRFTAPSHPDGFGLAVAERILAVVHRHICPTYPLPAK